MPLTLSYFISFMTFRFLFCLCSRASSRLPRAYIVFSVPLVSSFWALYFFFTIDFCIFFRFSYLFVFCHCSKVTTVSLSCCCLGFVVPYLLHRCCHLRCYQSRATLHYQCCLFTHKVGDVLFFLRLLIFLFFIIYTLQEIYYLHIDYYIRIQIRM